MEIQPLHEGGPPKKATHQAFGSTQPKAGVPSRCQGGSCQGYGAGQRRGRLRVPCVRVPLRLSLPSLPPSLSVSVSVSTSLSSFHPVSHVAFFIDRRQFLMQICDKADHPFVRRSFCRPVDTAVDTGALTHAKTPALQELSQKGRRPGTSAAARCIACPGVSRDHLAP